MTLGYDVLDAPAPSAPGQPVSTADGIHLYVAGQIPVRDGVLIASGTVGEEVDLPGAQACARQAMANALAQLHRHCGSLERIRAVSLRVYVAAAPGFVDHSGVALAASELLMDVLGDRGKHSRSAIGVASLPRRSPVEVELVASVVRRAWLPIRPARRFR